MELVLRAGIDIMLFVSAFKKNKNDALPCSFAALPYEDISFSMPFSASVFPPLIYDGSGTASQSSGILQRAAEKATAFGSGTAPFSL